MTLLNDELERLRAVTRLFDLPAASGPPLTVGVIRRQPDDFHVVESGQQPSGEGEYLYVYVRKTGQNTQWVARQLAECLGLPYKAVSYAGLKDRHAVTEQWLAVHMPGMADPDPSMLRIDGVEVLSIARHARKLRPGQLSFNRFDITVRDCADFERQAMEKRIAFIRRVGVPNYFGPQRFGRNGANLELAARLATERLPRDQRAFALSALRGALFNAVLARRVENQNWAECLPGERGQSDRPRGLAEDDRTVFEPVYQPTASLYGRGCAPETDIERGVLDEYPAVRQLLEKAGSRCSQRVLCARVGEMRVDAEGTDLRLSFALSPGAYATTVLKEIIEFRDAGVGK